MQVEIVNNHSILSMHAIRKITTFSGKHSFTLHPSLSPYGRTELWRNETLAMRGLEEPFFPVVLLCQFPVLAGNRFWFYIFLMYLDTHTVVVLCWFFWFWREIVFGTYLLSVQYSCAVVSVFLLWRES